MALREDVSGVIITDFQFGILEQDENGVYFVSKETRSIPNIPGLRFGFIFNYSNNTGRTVDHRWELILPGRPETARTIDGTTNVDYSPMENRVVSVTEGLTVDDSTQYSVNRIDPGDPSGQWAMEIYIGPHLYKTVIFNVR